MHVGAIERDFVEGIETRISIGVSYYAYLDIDLSDLQIDHVVAGTSVSKCNPHQCLSVLSSHQHPLWTHLTLQAFTLHEHRHVA